MINNKNVNPRHFLGVDFLRLLAALMVLLYHYGFWIAVSPASDALTPKSGLINFPELHSFTNFGWVGVQIFFVISGFVIAFSGEKASAFDFFVSRVVRLAPCVWICATITLIVALSFSVGEVFPQVKNYVKSIFFFPIAPWIDGSYWTLGIEISFYFLVYSLIRLGNFSLIYKLAISIGVISALFWIAQSIIGFDNASALGNAARQARRSRILSLLLVHHGIFFAIGVLIWIELTKIHHNRNIIWGIFFAAAGCLQIASSADSINRDAGTAYAPFLPCAIWIASLLYIVMAIRLNYLIHRLPQPLLRSLRTAGLMTFPLYLIHQVAGGIIMAEIISVGLNRWAALAVTTAAALALSWVIAKQIEPILQAWTKLRLLRMRALWAARNTAAANSKTD